MVPSDNPYVGKTIAEARLNEVPGGKLIELMHFDTVISPVSDKEPIMGNDRLIFAGQIDEILDLKASHGFVNANQTVFSMNDVDTIAVSSARPTSRLEAASSAKL